MTEPLIVIDDFTISQGASVDNLTFPIDGKTWRRNTATFTTIDNATKTLNAAAFGNGVRYNSLSSPAYDDGINIANYTQIDMQAISGWYSAAIQYYDSSNTFFSVNLGASGTNFWNISTHTTTDPTNLVVIEFKKASGAGTAVMGAGGAEPHLLCLDGTRLEVYHDGVYRLFEDRANDVVVNMGVQNTYITEICVMEQSTSRVIGHAKFDIDDDMQLHANFVNVVAGDAVLSDGNKTATIEFNGFKVAMQSKYRCFSLLHESWDPKKTATNVGGLLTTIVEEDDIASMLDATPLRVHDVQLGEWDMHALVCDAHFPHIVSLYGSSVIPGLGDKHHLLSVGDHAFFAGTDDFSRLQELWVVVQEGEAAKEVCRAVWTRNTAPDAAPSQSSVAPTSVCVDGGETLHTLGATAASATRFVDRRFDCGNGATVLLRMQANGSASFALLNGDAAPPTEGVLAQKDENHASTLVLGGAGGATTTSIYENCVEPHLAWKKNQTVEGDRARTGAIGMR